MTRDDRHSPTALTAGSLPALESRDWPVFEAGWVWMTGGGPGDPGLITLHALNALQQADAIIYDALVDPALLRWARPEAEIEYAGKRGGKPSPSQRDISLRLIELAREGKRVLRLKGGDPFVFGRGGDISARVYDKTAEIQRSGKEYMKAIWHEVVSLAVV